VHPHIIQQLVSCYKNTASELSALEALSVVRFS